MGYSSENIENLARSLTTTAITNELRQTLSASVNELILSDFDTLLQLLYRLDVDEKKILALLKENPGTDAGNTIADLIIERQVQKLKSRQQFSQQDNSISEEEKW